MQNKKGGGEDEGNFYKKDDKVIEKLRESLKDKREPCQPDEIVNYLKTDIEEKNKIKQI